MFKFFINKCELKSNTWQVLKAQIDFDSDDFKKAQDQAAKKSIHTMQFSQSGGVRGSAVKYNMQLMGIIAEMACEKYLSIVLHRRHLSSDWTVHRYDDVRTDDFKSPENEYDLKLQTVTEPKVEYSVESRSSITYNRSFGEGLIAYDIIGPYSSDMKNGELPNAIYLRPLYRYINYEKGDYEKENFESFLIDGAITLYLVAGCTQEELSNKGIIKSMGQGNTRYKVLPIINSTDIISFQDIIEKILKES